MPQVHTHYDNLKVSRDAPLEVIRAAYRSLSQKYHPDRNPGNEEAARVMAILNIAYETLCDPDKRRNHDQWIAATETGIDSGTHRHTSSVKPTRGQGFVVDEARLQHSPRRTASYRAGPITAHFLSNWGWYGLAAFFIYAFVTHEPSVPPPGPKPYISVPPPEQKPYIHEPAPVRPEYTRPNAAPNGEPWPQSAGYVKGYKRLRTKGFSSVSVDNSRNDFDVFVKLVTLDGEKAHPVRQFYIPALSSFRVNKVTAGNYDIRYRDLSNGELFRSEAFSLEEKRTNDGVEYSDITMTLYRVQNGNMQTFGLSEAEF